LGRSPASAFAPARGDESYSVEQREDGVVFVVGPREAADAVQLLGGADLVDAIEQNDLAKRLGGRTLFRRHTRRHPTTDNSADRAIGEVRRDRRRKLVVHFRLALDRGTRGTVQRSV
jgi:hypothetical protein